MTGESIFFNDDDSSHKNDTSFARLIVSAEKIKERNRDVSKPPPILTKVKESIPKIAKKYLKASDFVEQMILIGLGQGDPIHDKDFTLAQLIYALRDQLNYGQVCRQLVASDKYSVFIHVDLLCQRYN